MTPNHVHVINATGYKNYNLNRPNIMRKIFEGDDSLKKRIANVVSH